MPRDPNLKYQFVNITLDNITNGKEFYEVRKPNNHRHTGTYIIGNDFWYDGDQYKQYITEDTIPLFVNARNEFMNKIERAKNGQDDYTVIKVADYCLAYKKLPQKQLYSFVLIGNYTSIFTEEVYNFCNWHLILPTDSNEQEEANILAMKNALINSALANKDFYLAYAIKECMKTITQQEANYLYSVDGNDRFIPEIKVYDINDIDILDVKKGHYSFTCRSVNFYCKIKLQEKEYYAVWYPNDTKYNTKHAFVWKSHNANWLEVITYKFYRGITISDSVRQIIENKISDELFNN